jgi:signal transduction histidine kinase
MTATANPLAADTAEVLNAWHAQYGSAEAQALAKGLPGRLVGRHPALLRQARLVEAFWTFRRGEPDVTLVDEVERLHADCLSERDWRFAAVARIALAQWHGREQRYAEACEAAREALALCQRQGEAASRFDLALVLNGLGVYCSHLQEWQEALECFYQALEGIDALADPGLEAALRSNLGTVFFSTGNLDDALAAFDRAAGLATVSDNVRQQRNTALNRAHTLCRLQRWDEALAAAQPLLVPPLDPGLLGAYALAFAARAAAALGRLQEALCWARQATELVQDETHPDEAGAAWLALGQVELSAGEHRAALSTFERTLAALGTAGEVVYRLEAEEGRAQAARALGEDATAWQAMENAVALRERIASLATRTQVAATAIRGRLHELTAERNRARAAQAQAEAAWTALRANQAALLQAQQRAMASQLMASLAHQLNTPLGTCITANSSQQAGLSTLELMAQRGALRRTDLRILLGNGIDSADLIGSNLARLSRLVERFKLFGSHRFLTQERLPELIEDTAQRCVQRSRSLFDEVLTLSVDEVALRCDREALQGLLAELLDNALKARRPDDPPIQVQATASPTHIAIRIEDWGPGMSRAQVEQALSPFTPPADDAGVAGLGLGWSIVHHLATHVLGAQLHLNATPGIGTRVDLLLPVHVPTL